MRFRESGDPSAASYESLRGQPFFRLFTPGQILLAGLVGAGMAGVGLIALNQLVFARERITKLVIRLCALFIVLHLVFLFYRLGAGLAAAPETGAWSEPLVELATTVLLTWTIFSLLTWSVAFFLTGGVFRSHLSRGGKKGKGTTLALAVGLSWLIAGGAAAYGWLDRLS